MAETLCFVQEDNRHDTRPLPSQTWLYTRWQERHHPLCERSVGPASDTETFHENVSRSDAKLPRESEEKRLQISTARTGRHWSQSATSRRMTALRRTVVHRKNPSLTRFMSDGDDVVHVIS